VSWGLLGARDQVLVVRVGLVGMGKRVLTVGDLERASHHGMTDRQYTEASLSRALLLLQQVTGVGDVAPPSKPL
jgi:hypothetical protein